MHNVYCKFWVVLNSSYIRTTIYDDLFPPNTPALKSLKNCVFQQGTSDTNANFSDIPCLTFSTDNRPCQPHLSQNCVGAGDQGRSTLKPSRSRPLTLLYRNGGGCMFSRLSVNRELKLLLSTEPDIFVYAESLLFSTPRSKPPQILQGYDCYHLTAIKNSSRRGLSVF